MLDLLFWTHTHLCQEQFLFSISHYGSPVNIQPVIAQNFTRCPHDHYFFYCFCVSNSQCCTLYLVSPVSPTCPVPTVVSFLFCICRLCSHTEQCREPQMQEKGSEGFESSTNRPWSITTVPDPDKVVLCPAFGTLNCRNTFFFFHRDNPNARSSWRGLLAPFSSLHRGGSVLTAVRRSWSGHLH